MTDVEQHEVADEIEATIEDRDALKRRLVRAREVFQAARKMILHEHEVGEIGYGQRDQFLALVDSIEPAHTDPDAFGEEHVVVVEQAVIALRDKAISLKLDGDICSGGLSRFLLACGLRQWIEGEQPGSPYAGDYAGGDAA